MENALTCKSIKNNFLFIMQKLLWVLVLCMGTTRNSSGQVITYSSANPKTDITVTENDMLLLDYSYFMKLGIDLNGGILGSGVASGSKAELFVYNYDDTKTDGKGAEIYYSFATTYELEHHDKLYENTERRFTISNTPGAINFGTSSADILKRAQFQEVMARNNACPKKTWVEIASNGIFSSGIPDNPCFYFFVLPLIVHKVIVEIKVSNSSVIDKARIPGIVGGDLFIRDNKIVILPKSILKTFCDQNPGSPLCALYQKVQRPIYNQSGEDIMVANHRGYWGYNLGNGEPENSKEAASASFGLTPDSKIIEMDLLNTEDNQLIMLHDYVLKRLTDYPGDKYPFQMTWDEMKQYHLRRRNGTTTAFPVSKFTDILDRCVENDAIFMIDIKDKQSKGQGAGCTELCEFQSEDAKRSSWRDLCNRGIDVAGDKAKNIVVKTYYSATDVRQYVGERFYKVLWTPMIVSSRFDGDGTLNADQVIQAVCDFVDQWQSIAGDNVAYYETNFFKPNNPMLKPFVRNDVTYINLLEYIYLKTHRRTGVFSEEPAGPKGVVNRWGDWKMKDPDEDKRTDPFFILNQPYGNIMVITTDRSDVWKIIKQNF